MQRTAEGLARAAASCKAVSDLPRLEAAILAARKVGAEELDPAAYRWAGHHCCCSAQHPPQVSLLKHTYNWEASLHVWPHAQLLSLEAAFAPCACFAPNLQCVAGISALDLPLEGQPLCVHTSPPALHFNPHAKLSLTKPHPSNLCIRCRAASELRLKLDGASRARGALEAALRGLERSPRQEDADTGACLAGLLPACLGWRSLLSKTVQVYANVCLG